MGNSESNEKKNPLVPSGIIPNKPVINIDNLHNYQQQCKLWFQEKQWLSLPVKQVLISTNNSQYKQNIPYIEEYPEMFTNIDYVLHNDKKIFFGILNSGDKISNKWYRPTNEYFKYLCDLSSNSCKIDHSIKEAVIYTNNTFRILDEDDFKKQCEWWNKHVLNSEKNIYTAIQNIKMNSEKDKQYINILRNLISEYIENEDIENEYFKKNINNTICDYLKNIFIYIGSKSQDLNFNKYTKQFRNNVDKYPISKLPYLTIENVIDNYSFLSNVEKEQIRPYFNDYLEKMSNDIISRVNVLYKQAQYTPVINKNKCYNNIPDIDIVMYKEDGVIYCLSIQQLITRISNINPYTGKEISKSFLEKFDKEFKKQKDEYICENCETVIKDNKITLGKLINDVPRINHFCSSECVDEKEKEIKLLNEELKKSKHIQNKIFKFYDKLNKIKFDDSLLNEELKLKENDINSLNEYINELRTEKYKYESNLESCNVDNITFQNKYKNKINELQNKIQDDESRLNNLIQSKNKLEKELTDYNLEYIQERDKLNEKIKNLEQVLIEQQNKIKSEFSNHISKIKNKDNEIEKLKIMLTQTQDKDKLQAHLKQLENENKDLRKYLEKFFESLKQQDNELKTRQKYIEQLQKEKSEAIKNMQIKDSEQINKLAYQLQQLQNKLSSSVDKSEIQLLNNKIQRLEQEKNVCQSRILDTDTVNSLKHEISSLQFKMNSMTTKEERDKLLKQIQDLKIQISLCNPQSSFEIIKLKSEIESEKLKSKIAQDSFKSIQNELSITHELNKSLNKQLTDLNTIIKQNQLQINAVREEAEKEKKELTIKSSNTIDIAEKIRLQQEIDEITKKNEIFAKKKQDEINESVNKNIELNQKLKDAQINIEKQIQELKNQKQDEEKINMLEQIKQELEQSKKENKKLLEMCKTSEQQELDKKENEINVQLMKTENKQLKDELNELNNKIIELNNLLGEKDQDKDNLILLEKENEINKLRQEIKMIEQKCESTTCNIELEKLQIKLNQQQIIINEYELRTKQLSQEIDDLNSKLIETKEDSYKALDLEHQLKDKEKNKTELQTEISRMKIVEDELADKIKELTESKNNCDENLEKIGEQYKREIELLKEKNEKLLLKEQQLEKEMNQSNERYKQLHYQDKLNIIENQKEEIRKLTEKAELLDKLNKQLSTAQESTVELKKKEDEIKRREEQLKEDEIKRREEHDDVDVKIKQLTEALQKLPTQ